MVECPFNVIPLFADARIEIEQCKADTVDGLDEGIAKKADSQDISPDYDRNVVRVSHNHGENWGGQRDAKEELCEEDHQQQNEDAGPEILGKEHTSLEGLANTKVLTYAGRVSH